jgi:hypothetical protein
MTQAYGYNEVGKGLRDIKHFGNDYNPNKVGPIKSQAPRGSVVSGRISPEMKAKWQRSPKMGTRRTMRAAFSANASPGRKRLHPPVPNFRGSAVPSSQGNATPSKVSGHVYFPDLVTVTFA